MFVARDLLERQLLAGPPERRGCEQAAVAIATQKGKQAESGEGRGVRSAGPDYGKS